MKKNLLGNREVFKKKTKEQENYNPIANYDKFDLNSEDKKKLVQFEKDIQFHQKKTAEHLLALSEILYEAQNILANNKNGGFRIWFEDLGLKKDFVYMCLKRYNLYLEYEKEQAMIIPEKLVKVLTSDENTLKTEDIIEILSADKPSKKYNEVKESIYLFEENLNKVDFVIDESKKDELIKDIDKKYKLIDEITKEIRKLEKELEKYR